MRIRDEIDFGTLHQIYLSEEYRLDSLARYPDLRRTYEAIVESGKTPLVIDCGANIGLAAKYFSDHFPRALIVCIEPDADNIRLAQENNSSENVILVRAAVGSQSGSGTIIDPGLGNNAYRIDARAEGDTRIVSINELLAQYDQSSYIPFIVKIDIEGFEADLFSQNTDWIEKFPLLLIELHDWLLPKAGTSANFLRALAPLQRDFLVRGENVISVSNTLA